MEYLTNKKTIIWGATTVGLVMTCLLLVLYVSFNSRPPASTSLVSILWPQPMVTLTETQTFRVEVDPQYDPSEIRVLWSVEDWKRSGEMEFDGTSFISEVNTADWDWKRDSQYEIQFTTLTRNSEVIATSSIAVLVGQITPSLAEAVPEVVSSSTAPADFTAPQFQMGAVVMAPAAATAAITPAEAFRVEWIAGPIRNNQQFVFRTEGYAGRELSAFWSADGGHQNIVYKDQNAKVFTTAINVFGWLWKGAGPYPITFSVTDKSTSAVIASEVLELYWKGKPGESEIEFRGRGADIKVPATTPPVVLTSNPVTTTPKTTSLTKPPTTTPPKPSNPTTTSPTPTPKPIPTSIPTLKPVPAITPIAKVLAATSVLGKSTLYTPTKPAVQSSLSKLSDTNQKSALGYILAQPSSVWLNGDSYETDAYIRAIIAAASAKNTVPSFVLYNIVQRDCNSYSSGGAKSMADYKAWINRLAGVFKDTGAIIVVEPDALAMLNCVAGAEKSQRLEMIAYAVTTLTKASPKLLVYIDAGHPFWVNAEEMAKRLTGAGIGSARGFAINVSSYASTQDNVTYGTYLSNLLGGKHYVVDSSRNGNGRAPDGQWCNPNGRALGQSGTIYPGTKGALDAVLWIKFPGESDGTCNGGPGAGQWWTTYATDLYNNRK